MCHLHTQPASYYKPKIVSHKYTSSYFSILVCLKSALFPSSHPAFVGNGKLSKEGLHGNEAMLNLCMHSPPFTNKITTQMQTSANTTIRSPRNRLREASPLPPHPYIPIRLCPGGVLGKGFVKNYLKNTALGVILALRLHHKQSQST